MQARIVIRGSAYHGNQQRNLVQIELIERPAEIEPAGEAKSMYGTFSVLAEIDLIDIGVHEIRLVEAGLENYGHQRFLDLAPQRLPVVEKVAAHQLLCERAAALLDRTRAQVDPRRAQDCFGIDAVMAVELAVLDDLESFGQQRRHFERRDDDAIFTVDRENAADQERIESEERDLGAIGPLQALDRTLPSRHADRAGLADFFGELYAARRDVDSPAAPMIGTRPLERIGRRVMQPNQFLLEGIGGQRQPGIELERLCIDLGWQRPASTLELRSHDAIQVDDQEHVGDDRNQRDE